MPLLRDILLNEKKAVIPDEDIKERSWIIVFRYNPSLEVLIVRDSDKRWTLPGGQLDNGETAEEAAYRELEEETGIVAKKLEFLKTIYHDKPNKLKVSNVYYTEISKTIKVRAGDDAEKSKWITPSEAKKLSDLSDPKVDVIKLAMEKVYDAGKELKETIELARSMGLPLQLLTESKKKRKTNEGYLIVFEGIDGSGKTTARKKLKKWLEEKGWKVAVSKWGSSPEIAKLLKVGKQQKWLTPMLFSLLHASDMVWRHQNEIAPFLKKGHVVICDRYHYTSYVRDCLRGVDKKILDGIYKDFVEPDLLFHFKVSPRLAVERLLKDKGFKYYSSGMDIGYHKKMEECALVYEKKMDAEYCNILPKVKSYKSVDSERSIDEIFEEIKKFIHEKIKEVERSPKEVIEDNMIKMSDLMRDSISSEAGDSFKILCEEFHEHKDWFLYEGSDKITTVFEDNSRQTFKVHFRDNRNENREKHRMKAARTWKRLAMEIRKNAGLSEGGNPIIIPWQECFSRALKSDGMKEFVDDGSAAPIFETYIYETASLNEMTYDELQRSMQRYRTKADINRGTTTGAEGREQRSKEVKVRSLKIISTLGRDKEEHETSTFSYKSNGSDQRWNGLIRFIENKKDGESIPVAPKKDDQDVEVNCSCFAGDTLVLMADGAYKPIKEVGPGDFVYTHKGRIRPVIGNVARIPKETENVYKLDITGFPESIIVTGNHPFYTLRGNTREQLFQWVKVDDFKECEWFLSPRLNPSTSNQTIKEKEYSCEEGSLKVLRNIEKIDYKQEVWDLCVEEDHSFIVAGIAVANCPDYKYVWAKANSDVDAGETGTKTTGGFSAGGAVSKIEPKSMQYKTQAAPGKPVNIFEVGEGEVVNVDRRCKNS